MFGKNHLNLFSNFLLTYSCFKGISFYIGILTILILDSVVSGFSAKMFLRYKAGSFIFVLSDALPCYKVRSLKMLRNFQYTFVAGD